MQPNQHLYYAPYGPPAPQQPPASQGSSLQAQLLALSQSAVQKLETAARTHAPNLTSSVDRVMHSEPVGRLMAAVGLSNNQQPASMQQSYAPYPQHHPQSHPQHSMQYQQYQHYQHCHPQQQHFSQPPDSPQPPDYQTPQGPYPYPYPHHSQQHSHALSPYPAQQHQQDYAYQQQQWQHQQWQQQQWQQQQQPPYMYSQYPQQQHPQQRQQPAHFGSSPSAGVATAAAPARDIPIIEATVILDDPSSSTANAPRSSTHAGVGASSSSCTVPEAAAATPPQYGILQHSSSKCVQQQQQQGQSQVLQKLHASAVPAAGAAAASLIGHWLHQDGALFSELQLLPNGCMQWLKSQQGPEAVNSSSGSTVSSTSNAQTGGRDRPGLNLPAWMKKAGAGSRDRVTTQQVAEVRGASDDTAQLLAPGEQAAAGQAGPDREDRGGSSSSSQKQQQQQQQQQAVLVEWLGVWKLVRGNSKQGQLKLTFVVQEQQEQQQGREQGSGQQGLAKQQQQVYVVKYQRQALDDAIMLDGIAHIKIG